MNMTRRSLLCGVLLLAATPAFGAEQLDLATPVTTPDLTAWQVSRLDLDWTGARIVITLRGPNREQKRHDYSGAAATTLMTALNKANLTTNSLHKRILNRLVADGVIAGTISGVPD